MISCKDISFSYDGKVPTLSNVTLDIADGEFLCILGGNGSGKSTLAKHLNVLLVPDSGSVEVDGLNTSDPQLVYDVRSRVGMVFQNPDDQLVATLVENDIAFGPENLGVPTSELSQRVADALASVGLMGFEQHETHALSGGQKQRVAIAGALAMHPEVLILDEASSMLDPRGRHGLLKVCQELNRAGMTIVMITHFMEEAALADRVVVLDRGRIALEGTPEEILIRADELHSLNLEEPFACQLALELKKRGLDITPHVDEESVVAEIRAAMGRHIETSLCDKTATSDEAPQSSDAAPLIQFEHVYYSYEKSTCERARRRKKNAPAAQAAEWGNDPNAVWALRDISFDVHEGEILGIAGHTGSGKSTIIQHMNGLVHPTQGRVLLQGASMADKHVNETAKTTVGMVFQYPEHQLFANTVFEDVAFGPQNLGLSASEVTERVLEALRLVGLDADEVAQKSPFELSGGQQRRCAFAGVLAMRPRVLVLDEPVAGLDPAARTEFLQLIDDLHARGLTIVMVSHSMEDIATHCDRVLIMNKGSIVSLGTPREVFASDRDLKSIGLGLPAPQHMARLLRDAGISLPHRRLYSTKTLAESIVALAAGGVV